MSVDHLPARTTTVAATGTTEINTVGDEAPPSAGKTLDHANIHAHKDWRHIASEWVGLAAAFTAAAAVGGMATNTLLAVSHTLAVIAGALVGVLVWLLAEKYREGRRWVYAETDVPYNGDMPGTP
ncbi:hypothetical protein ACGFIW_01560 [Micromonospora sp. NPDC048935]|uniref:hypothetical protein n=1 Tax=Micromonospora sp. NPDC048935 TaxID=3364262 RepID=UPI0037101E0E